ncbi:DUF418 domain-containing protein [Brachybacterium fresconis]|uniref:Membrane protein YeiB n=1 Tax=Brachybacterium fresconis TaxID=173363 RepID=A0ABS4YIW6_9MICO|nr:putative membrane protein YeiB [Brachybacterium fresconis]
MASTASNIQLPLFAFLFGYGMVQFYRSRIDRGMEPRIVRAMMRRRHWGMLLLGLLHATLLFYGDILGAYAIGGLLLVWIFFGRRTRTLIIWLAVIVGLMALFAVFSVVSAVALVYFAPPEALAAAGSGTFEMGQLRDVAYGQPYLVSLLARLGVWAVGIVPMGAVVTPLPILLGWLAARRRVLDEPWRHRRLLTGVAVGGIVVGWLGGLPVVLGFLGALPLPESVSWAFSGVNMLAGMVCGVGYAAAFGLLAARLEGRGARSGTHAEASPDGAPQDSAPTDSAPTDRAERRETRRAASAAEAAQSPAERAYGVPAAEDVPAPTRSPGVLLRALSAVGQRSLSFYLFQSVLLAPLMASWGIGLGVHLGTAGAVGIAFAVWLLSLPISLALDARGLRGPAELVLRRMTYGTHDPRPSRAAPTP